MNQAHKYTIEDVRTSSTLLCPRGPGRHGAILADEMGLGKTLQSVALCWTLLRQGAYGGRPVAKRVLVVTPGSLVQNWATEFNKWLGRERISVFTVDQVQCGALFTFFFFFL